MTAQVAVAKLSPGDTETASVTHLGVVARNIYHATFSFRVHRTFSAGQYLKLWLNPSLSRSYSIASSPSKGEVLEIFLGFQSGESVAQELISRMEETREARVSLPFGEAYYRKDDSRPILLLAGGTGYGYVRSILLEALRDGGGGQVVLLWAARDKESLFDGDTLSALATQYPQFSYQLWLEEPAGDERACHGDILRALDHYCSGTDIISDSNIYIGGGPGMVRAVRAALQGGGADAARIFSD